jgi:cytochrome d ubiquinol oxidase subunit I
MGTAGWVLTENGRQPWIVDGLMLTKDGLSPSVGAAQIAVSMTVFFLVYATLGVIAAVLMVRHARRGLPPEEHAAADRDRAPELAY